MQQEGELEGAGGGGQRFLRPQQGLKWTVQHPGAAATIAASELFIVVTMWQTKANNNNADSLILTTF